MPNPRPRNNSSPSPPFFLFDFRLNYFADIIARRTSRTKATIVISGSHVLDLDLLIVIDTEVPRGICGPNTTTER
jgi:hypothetical protein